jgi:hypothetical protein
LLGQQRRYQVAKDDIVVHDDDAEMLLCDRGHVKALSGSDSSGE